VTSVRDPLLRFGFWDMLEIQMIIQGKLRVPQWNENEKPRSRVVVDLGSFRFVSAQSGPVDARNQPSPDEPSGEEKNDDAAPPACA
jgi:hypothetical protein